MDAKNDKNAAAADYYDDLSKLKGVQTINGSMTLTSVNTRGFGGISNTRFVQLMDGMDNAAPLLNFPTGNIVGIGELDINNVNYSWCSFCIIWSKCIQWYFINEF
jgi:iron complex outermembrane receptor protein